MSEKIKKSKEIGHKKFYNKIKIRNANALFKDVNSGAKEMVIAYDNRDKNPNRFKRVFREKILDKMTTNVILGKKYEETGKKKKSFKKILKLIVYTLLSITIIAVTNIVLLERFSSALNEYLEQTPDIKDRKIVTNIKEIFSLFIQKMKELSILQRLLAGTLLINTFVNQIPNAYQRANQATDAPFFEMLKDVFKNLVNLEKQKIIKS